MKENEMKEEVGSIPGSTVIMHNIHKPVISYASLQQVIFQTYWPKEHAAIADVTFLRLKKEICDFPHVVALSRDKSWMIDVWKMVEGCAKAHC